MKKIILVFVWVGILTYSLPANTVFSRKADLVTPKNAGRIYEIGSKGFIIIEGKRGDKMTEKLSPRVVIFSGKSFIYSDLYRKSIASDAPSSTYEIDLLKYEF